MPAQLMRPEVLLLIVFVLWGIAGKLDEPLEGFDPEPRAGRGRRNRRRRWRAVRCTCCVSWRRAGRARCGQAPTPVLTAYSPTTTWTGGRHSPQQAAV
jgi:hypothetical protein